MRTEFKYIERERVRIVATATAAITAISVWLNTKYQAATHQTPAKFSMNFEHWSKIINK